MTTPLPPDDNLRQLLDAARSKTPTGNRRRWLLTACGLLASVVLAIAAAGKPAPAGQYLTEPAARGALVVTATASGTLQPTKSVDVGSELSGTLADVRVQENDVVSRGQVLARLDTAKLEDAVI